MSFTNPGENYDKFTTSLVLERIFFSGNDNKANTFFSGSHLLVGVRHPVLRMYDVNTTQCFTGSIPR